MDKGILYKIRKSIDQTPPYTVVIF